MNQVMDRPICRPWWRRQYWLRSGLAVPAAALLRTRALLFVGTPRRRIRLVPAGLTIASLTQGAYHDFIPLRGKVAALNTVYLDALEGGRVERVLAEAGDTVTAGQPLVELSNTELELDVLDREGRLIESITQLQSYETQLEQNRGANRKALAQIDYNVTRLQRSVARRIVLVADDAEPVEVKDQAQDELDYDVTLRPMQDESNRRQERLRVQQLPQIHSQLVKL